VTADLLRLANDLPAPSTGTIALWGALAAVASRAGPASLAAVRDVLVAREAARAALASRPAAANDEGPERDRSGWVNEWIALLEQGPRLTIPEFESLVASARHRDVGP